MIEKAACLFWLPMRLQAWPWSNEKLETRSVSNNELKKSSQKVSPSPSSNATSKKQGMFDVVGNFSAISDVLPSVSSVTKSLTTASTNIDGVMGASKLSKVVKFDMSSKVMFYEQCLEIILSYFYFTLMKYSKVYWKREKYNEYVSFGFVLIDQFKRFKQLLALASSNRPHMVINEVIN